MTPDTVPTFSQLQGDLQAALQRGDSREAARLKDELFNYSANHEADTRTPEDKARADRVANDKVELASARLHLQTLRRREFTPELALKAAEVRLRNALAACGLSE